MLYAVVKNYFENVIVGVELREDYSSDTYISTNEKGYTVNFELLGIFRSKDKAEKYADDMSKYYQDISNDMIYVKEIESDL